MVFTAVFTWVAYHRAPGPGQSPRSAILEAWANLVVGFSLNYCFNLLLIPLAMPGGHLSMGSNFWLGWCFTAVSILRQYALRRWFNARLHGLAVRLAGAK
jgi:hypothetical protein